MTAPFGKRRFRMADGSGVCEVIGSMAAAVKRAKELGAVSMECAYSDEVQWTAKESGKGSESEASS